MSHPLIACTNINCCFMSPTYNCNSSVLYYCRIFAGDAHYISILFRYGHTYAVSSKSSADVQHYNVGDMKQHLMFVHAISECDTVSAPYMKGKNIAIEVLRSFGDQDYLSTFN